MSRRHAIDRTDAGAAAAAHVRLRRLVRNLVLTPGPWHGAGRRGEGGEGGEGTKGDEGGEGGSEESSEEGQNALFCRIYTRFWKRDRRTNAHGMQPMMRRNYRGM